MQSTIRRVWKRIIGWFLAGLFAILPLVITVAAIVWIAGFVKGFIGPGTVMGRLIQSAGGTVVSNITLAYVLGCVFILAVIFLLGLLVQLGLKKLLHGLIDPIVRRIPLAGSVYTTAAQVIGMLEKKDDADLQSMSVVYCVFGKENGSGLLALMPTPDRYHFDGRDYYVIFIPTSPLPMTGGLLFVPVESVRPVEMSVESLMSIYLSMGVTGPQFLKGLKPSG